MHPSGRAAAHAGDIMKKLERHMNETNPSLLLVDDDPTLRRVLAAALEKRGFAVTCAADAEQAEVLARRRAPDCAVVDLNLPGASGLSLVAVLAAIDATMRIVVLTGYGSVATTVEAIKLGATHYLTKPADADEIVAALYRDAGVPDVPMPPRPLSLKRLEWEYIQRCLADNDGNVSATARQLGM